MNQELVEELKKVINKIKIEIIDKQQELDNLIDEYQELIGIEAEN